MEEDEDAVPLQQTEQYEGDSYRDGEPERPVGPPLSLDAPSVRPLGEAPQVACLAYEHGSCSWVPMHAIAAIPGLRGLTFSACFGIRMLGRFGESL